MSKDPAVLFYTSDFLSGTAFFTMEQKGQYITLLCEQHQLGHIPDEHMLNICFSYDSPVLKKFVKDENGLWYNVRMEEEHQKRSNYCKSRRNNRLQETKPKKKKTYVPTYEKHMSLHMENGNDNGNVSVIVNKLNSLAETNYKPTSKKTKMLILSRMNEGFNVSDFEAVIKKKSEEWKGTEHEKYLRPQTLFGTNFESYLNQKIIKQEKKYYAPGSSWKKRENN